MVGMLNDLFIAASVRWSHFVEDFKNDESGLSGVVVAVLLVVISVLAVFALWSALNGKLQMWWNQISGKGAVDTPNIGGGNVGP